MFCEAAIDEESGLAPTGEIAQLAARDPAALTAVVSRYQHRLYRYLLRLLRNPAEAEDAFQQTWLNVVRQIRRYDPRRSFDAWLFAIAHNLAMDSLRRRREESLGDTDSPAPARALDGLLASERSALLAAAIEHLPPVYREAITLRFEEGLKLEEIATVMQVPLATAKSRVQRALLALREKLGPKEDLL
jgi:RNA polymerase sigma-70 factor (ECF subfamily)